MSALVVSALRKVREHEVVPVCKKSLPIWSESGFLRGCGVCLYKWAAWDWKLKASLKPHLCVAACQLAQGVCGGACVFTSVCACVCVATGTRCCRRCCGNRAESQRKSLLLVLSSNGLDPPKFRKQSDLIQRDFRSDFSHGSPDCTAALILSNASCINSTFLPASPQRILSTASLCGRERKKQVLLNRQAEQALCCAGATNSSYAHAATD